MDSFVINGPSKLKGSVDISGSKNAALPIMVSCIACPGKYTLKNVPNLRDTRTIIKLLEIIGATIIKNNNCIIIDSTKCDNPVAPYSLVKTMRASFYVLGPLLSRFQTAKVSLPGGCAWGPRPVDFHIKAFRKMGASISLNKGYVIARGVLKGTTINFKIPSVGATGNVLMGCINLNEKVVIKNAAMEPEIQDLCNFLIKMGVKIKGIGTSQLIIQGKSSNKEKEHKIIHSIIPDRIEVGTFILASLMTKSKIKINKIYPEHIKSIISELSKIGVSIKVDSKNSITIIPNKKIKKTNVTTGVYPGFPTDMQSQWTSLMTISDGISTIQDTIYYDRFSHIPELNRLGANIILKDNIATINGVKKLVGTSVMCTDLRAGAALVLAALTAEGITKISRIYHIDRGYEDFEIKLEKINVDIKRFNEKEG